MRKLVNGLAQLNCKLYIISLSEEWWTEAGFVLNGGVTSITSIAVHLGKIGKRKWGRPSQRFVGRLNPQFIHESSSCALVHRVREKKNLLIFE